ncbi:hypothetical protein CN520_00575 [Bacillus cereus]|uniref:hypothetical protein n=1 Tax=Bacillus cereus TaxID=1396 RepID=UPI000BEBEF59|nr:hypothetical protein [Bacillus cereus]PDZ39793.1 hypothetical protein CON18_13090 [Bacillus cereus]PES11092.1 hypothetical protein CN494_22565 [Bacillus cereus]PET44033.1 hypothetical protein CN520_00575 [Bacillus cereus]PFA14373.1 hypothetical protein CN377_10775 [Bacillus cereus]PFC37675.1 hypothetical protein CN310_13835 [Bacillus cereus]
MKSNDGGNVEYGIRIPIDDEHSEEVQFGELMGQIVTAVGCWCEDVSHNHKTELQLLILDSCPVMGQWKWVKVIVFSDHSPRFMIIPPRPSPSHRDQSTHATFNIKFLVTPDNDVTPVYSIVSEWNMTDWRNFNIVGGNGAFVLRDEIESGYGDGKGYYRAHIDLDYGTLLDTSYIGLFQPGSEEHWGDYSAYPAQFLDYLKGKSAENVIVTKVRTHVINGQRVWSEEFDRNGRYGHFQ